MAMGKFGTVDRAALEAGRELTKNPAGLLAASGLDLGTKERAKVLARLTQMPQGTRKTYLRAMGGKAPRSAIRAFCQMCVGWERLEIAACSDPACPLFPYRPASPSVSAPRVAQSP